MLAPRIRPVVPGDLPALRAVIAGTGLFPPELLDEMIGPHLGGDGAEAQWLTVDDGGAQAIAYVAPERMTEGTWNLLLIAVHPDRQGQGMGASLMGHIERDLAERGARVLLVETSGDPGFARTRAFYEGNGYVREATIREFYAAGEDKVVFWKALAAAPPVAVA